MHTVAEFHVQVLGLKFAEKVRKIFYGTCVSKMTNQNEKAIIDWNKNEYHYLIRSPDSALVTLVKFEKMNRRFRTPSQLIRGNKTVVIGSVRRVWGSQVINLLEDKFVWPEVTCGVWDGQWLVSYFWLFEMFVCLYLDLPFPNVPPVHSQNSAICSLVVDDLLQLVVPRRGGKLMAGHWATLCSTARKFRQTGFVYKAIYIKHESDGWRGLLS